ncbi:hypothetical protein LJE82_07790 [bacterium BMS3Abin03]|nr:hypothetical protein [bacterium BMS3Abin03]
MNLKKNTIFIYASIGLIILSLAAILLFRSFHPSDLLANYFSVHFNNPERVNLFAYSQLRKLILLGLAALLFLLGVKYLHLESVKKLTRSFEEFVLKVFSVRFLFAVILAYLFVLFYLAVSRYDLGIDEAVYPLYAKHFWDSGFAHCLYDGKLIMVDNFAMLPVYIASGFNFIFGLTEVWHFKLLISLLSLTSVYIISRISQKLYNSATAVLFIFFLAVQPGFGFVASSFFGEIVQGAFFFSAVYLWLKDDFPLHTKKILLISLLFALSIQTKFQVSQVLVLTLFIFHFIDNKKRALSILGFTLVIVVLLAVIRLIPALIDNKNNIVPYMRFWADQFGRYTSAGYLFYIDRAHFFNRFLPVIFLPFLLTGIFMWTKTPVERFLSLFTLLFFLWWIMYFKLSNYRVVFIGIIPLCFLLSAFANDYYRKALEAGKKSRRSLVYMSSAFVMALMLYGFSQNLIYAAIGNNDAVQFDLDETKSRLFTPVAWDNSQKEFYGEAAAILQSADSIYIPTVGQACFVPQFYLGENRIFDYTLLVNSLKETDNAKYVIIDRTAFPLGLSEGYKKIDSLNVHRNLILKKGGYELYSVSKKN